jgi:Ca-activated chloride channel family protein
MFRFAATGWLFALALVPALVLAFVALGRSRRRALERFAEHPLVRRLTATVSVPARRTRAGLLVGAVGLIVLALARPQFGTRVETVRSVGQDIVVAFDLSESMLAEDVTPSRLERARLSILRLLRNLDGDRIGLVAFAGTAFVQSPLTADYGAAAMFLNAMEPDLMPVQGTDLAEALRVGLDALEEGARDARVLVLVTDGEGHEEDRSRDVDVQTQRAIDLGVTIHAVGIGSAEGAPIPAFDGRGQRSGFLRDEDGTVVTTRLDEETLRTLASHTPGGRYVREGVGGTALDDLVDEIASVDGEAVDERRITQFEEQYQIFLGLALALLVAEALIPERRRKEEEWHGRFEA